ncbi:MAG: class I SAM-dependent methyltransferase [Candidatus Korobacteraceae bacterium]
MTSSPGLPMKYAAIRLANRNYRRIKTALLTHQPPVITGLFFRLLSLMDGRLAKRKQTPLESQANMLWKQRYLESYQQGCPRFAVETAHAVAAGSADHVHPRGAFYDNSVNPRFNLKVYELLRPQQKISIMDLGCAGGGMVRSFLEDSHDAIGLEGSDVARRTKSGEWDTIPFNLFTCDLTKPFQVTRLGRPFQFDLITAWEVLEHIPDAALTGMIDSIVLHLRPGGYFIGSVDLLPDGNPLIGAVYHQTLEPAAWWEQRFCERGFVKVAKHPFTTEDMVRGHGLSLKDWSPEDGHGIHLILQKVLT